MNHADPGDRPRPAPLPIVVTHQAGVRFAAQVGTHELILDQPLRGGGQDAGPSPVELLGTALGSCIALYVHKFLVARHLAEAGLRVEVTQHTERNPHRIARFDVRIHVPGEIPAVHRALVETVARVCPVYNTLASGAEITISVEYANADGPHSRMSGIA